MSKVFKYNRIVLILLVGLVIIFQILNFSIFALLVSVTYFVGFLGLIGKDWWGPVWIICGALVEVAAFIITGYFPFRIIFAIPLVVLSVLEYF